MTSTRSSWGGRKPASKPFPSSLEKVACGAFCAYPSLDGTLRVDLRSTKRAPARLSDIRFVSAGCAPRAKSVVFASCAAGGNANSETMLGDWDHYSGTGIDVHHTVRSVTDRNGKGHLQCVEEG